MSGLCSGRVAIVTGAGGGLGRAHALELAAQGAKVVVNDLGVARDGAAVESSAAAEEVVAEIRATGGEAVANGDDVSDWEGAGRLVQAALSSFGRLDVLVNNAGFLRDRMLVNLEPEEWDAVVRVHLRGSYCCIRRAALHWRGEAKAGRQPQARIVNTTSGAGLFGNIGQANYVAAKAGVSGLTLALAAELGRYGVTVNAISPIARTRMTEELFASAMGAEGAAFDRNAPENISPLVAWLASPASADVTGQVFSITGGRLSVVQGWTFGPTAEAERRWDAEEVGNHVLDLIARAAPPVPVRGTEASGMVPEGRADGTAECVQ